MMRRTLYRAATMAGLAVGALWDLALYPVRREFGAKAWYFLLRLHCATNGRSTATLRRMVRRTSPAAAPIKPFQSLFGSFDSAAMLAMAEQIRQDGYCVFPAKIPAGLCDEIAVRMRSFDGWLWRDKDGPHAVTNFDPDRLTKPRYEMPEASTWTIPAFQKIIADPIFVNLSQAYFDGQSMLKEVALWWSPASGNNAPDADAAQLFHFDYDAAPIWLKFFVYLNDVSALQGPHVFVKGSHKLGLEKSRALLARGYVRLDDAEIAQIHGADNVTEICGAKGTVFAVDTMGFHKGGVPTQGHRLLAQLEFATPLFVPASSRPLPMPQNAGLEILAARQTYPRAFARFPAPAKTA